MCFQPLCSYHYLHINNTQKVVLVRCIYASEETENIVYNQRSKRNEEESGLRKGCKRDDK